MSNKRDYTRVRRVGSPTIIEPRPRVVHSARYTGRGLGWRKMPLTRRQARRIARYNAGLIVDAVLSDGWDPEHLTERFGKEGLDMIKDQLLDIALWLRETGDPDGESTR